MNNNTKSRFKLTTRASRSAQVNMHSNPRNKWNTLGKVARNDSAVAKRIKQEAVSQLY